MYTHVHTQTVLCTYNYSWSSFYTRGGIDLTCISAILISVHNSRLGNGIIALITYKKLVCKIWSITLPFQLSEIFFNQLLCFIHFVLHSTSLKLREQQDTYPQTLISSICFLHMCKTLNDMKNRYECSLQWLIIQVTGYLVSLIVIANKSYITIVHKCNYPNNIYYLVPYFYKTVELYLHIPREDILWLPLFFEVNGKFYLWVEYYLVILFD